MNAKFSVGEVIILQSKSLPQYNGEYTVEAILQKGELFSCRLTNTLLRQVDGGNAYVLSMPLVSPDTGHETFWAESALRKKQEPSKFSYTQLMQSLRSPIYEVS